MKYLIPTYRKKEIKSAELLVGLDYLLFMDKEDFDIYSKKYNCFLLPDGIQGNIARVRNFILNYAKEQKYDSFIMCDDDISKFYKYDSNVGARRREINAFEFDYILNKFDSLFFENRKCIGWTIAETEQPRDYKGRVDCNNACFMSGTFSVYFPERIFFEFDENLPLKEDYDFTLQALTNGKIIYRFKGLSYKPERITSNIKNFGGCSTYRTKERENQQIELMKKKWGNFIKYKNGDINGIINYKEIYKNI